jgi:hypothetical protein
MIVQLDRYTLRKEEEIINGVPYQSPSLESGDPDVKEKEIALEEKKDAVVGTTVTTGAQEVAR